MNRITLILIFGLGVYFLIRPRSANAYAMQPIRINYNGGNMTKRTSPDGIAMLKQTEALRLSTYQDQAGKPTIGYGHLIRPGENLTKITPLYAEQLLVADLADAELAVNTLVTVPLSQNQFDALVSFTFNVGVNAFRNSTLLARLNAGDYNAAAAEFDRWNKVTINGQKVVSNGLVARRAAEKNTFMA